MTPPTNRTIPLWSSQDRLLEDAEAGRRVQGGVTSTDAVLSAYVSGNAEVFPRILELHVPRGATVADVTWGKGVFWSQVDPEAYSVLKTDIDRGVDLRKLPYEEGSLDCLVLDPPYMEGLHRRA